MDGFMGMGSGSVRDKIANELKSFVVAYSAFRAERIKGKRGNVQKEMRDANGTRNEQARVVAEFEHTVETRRRAIDRGRNSYGADFDRLCRMEGVGRVDVDEKTQSLIIHTKTLTRIINPGDRGGKETTYDIGQRKIIINFDSSVVNRNSITLELGGYAGQFTNGFTEGSSICFGGALNPRIDELLGDCEIASLVQVLLTFLRYEKSVPQGRKDAVPRNTTDEPGYATDVEKSFSRDAFVELMRNIAERRLDEFVRTKQKMIDEMRKSIDELEGKLRELRYFRNHLDDVLSDLEALKTDVLRRILEEANKFIALDVDFVQFYPDKKILEIEHFVTLKQGSRVRVVLCLGVGGDVKVRRIAGDTSGPDTGSIFDPELVIVIPTEGLMKIQAARVQMALSEYFKGIRTYVDQQAKELDIPTTEAS